MNAATATVLSTGVFKEKVKPRKSPDKTVSYVNPYDFRATTEVSYSLKRGLDLFLGGIAFLVFLVLLPFIALGIKLSSKGPIFIRQPRTGKHGHIFFSYKFRTVHTLNLGTDYLNPAVAKKDDKPVFPFGQFLRKMNLDELPQILNVIKGEMSLIGPGSYVVNECEYRSRTFDDHFYRYMLKPGIMGLARAHGYHGGTMDDDLMRKQLNFDLIYVEKNSLLFDLKIMHKTVKRKVFGDTIDQ